MLKKPEIPTHIDIPLSPEAERILAFASEEADTLGHREVDVGHLLLGILREEEGVAGQILRSAGLSLKPVRRQLRLGEADKP